MSENQPAQHVLEEGMRLDIAVDGYVVKAGYNTINNEKQLAYLPRTSHRFKPGDVIHALPENDAEGGFDLKVICSRQSSFIHKMVVVVVEEVNG